MAHPEFLAPPLIFLAASVVVVAIFRQFSLPPILAYLLTGIAIGPNALGLVEDSETTRYLAEFGVVFLMFSIGLEFSLGQLMGMRRLVFGVGAAQVFFTLAIVVLFNAALGMGWLFGVAIGAAVVMSSTAVVSKVLAERLELHSRHGRLAIAVLLFQDLAVPLFLILIPALAGGTAIAEALGFAAIKAVVVLSLILGLGKALIGPWLRLVARQKTNELTVLNVLLITLGLAYLTELAGLSMALGAFLAGILISETVYRFQVEADIAPFRDVLLGLFFITVGMLLDLSVMVQNWAVVLSILFGIVAFKFGVVALVALAFREDRPTALRTALALAHVGEFSFVLILEALHGGLLREAQIQPWLAAMVLSMVLAPMLISHGAFLARLLLPHVPEHGGPEESEPLGHAAEALHGHAILCGYGRSGQRIGHVLQSDGVPYLALDLDAVRVEEARTAGETVFFGDAGRREIMQTAGIERASVVVVSFTEMHAAMKVLEVARELNPQVPVVVRTVNDFDMEHFERAGAQVVVPEVLEGSLTVGAHVLSLVGRSSAHVLAVTEGAREARYRELRQYFPGALDSVDGREEHQTAHLGNVVLDPENYAVGRALGDMNLEALGVKVEAIRRHGVRGPAPALEITLAAGDVLVLLGTDSCLSEAEKRLRAGS